MSWRVSASSAPKGSSRSITSQSVRNVRRSAVRWRIPPEICDGQASAKPVEPEPRELGAGALPRRARSACRASCGPTAALSSTVRHGIRRSACGM